MIKKSLLFCVMSYLLARLEIIVHFSKSVMLQLRPDARIEYIRRHDTDFTEGTWIFSNERDYFAHIDNGKKELILKEMPERLSN